MPLFSFSVEDRLFHRLFCFRVSCYLLARNISKSLAGLFWHYYLFLQNLGFFFKYSIIRTGRSFLQSDSTVWISEWCYNSLTSIFKNELNQRSWPRVISFKEKKWVPQYDKANGAWLLFQNHSEGNAWGEMSRNIQLIAMLSYPSNWFVHWGMRISILKLNAQDMGAYLLNSDFAFRSPSEKVEFKNVKIEAQWTWDEKRC